MEEESHMETTETKNAIETAATGISESARKAGGKLRTVADRASDSSRRWARRCGEMLSKGAHLTTLQANQRVLGTKLDRAYRELGRAVYAAHEKGEEVGPLIEFAPVRATLEQVKEFAENLRSNEAKLAELRKSGTRGGSA
jgi:hypothetical protein